MKCARNTRSWTLRLRSPSSLIFAISRSTSSRFTAWMPVRSIFDQSSIFSSPFGGALTFRCHRFAGEKRSASLR